MIRHFKKIFKVVLFLFTGWYIILGFARILLHFKYVKVMPTHRIYVKHVPYYLDETRVRRLRIFSQLIGGIFSVAIISFIFLQNYSPFGESRVFILGERQRNISPLTPNDRVEQVSVGGQIAYRQVDDLTYFKVKMPSHFDHATVRITYKSPYPDQEVYLGFQDQPNWHYHMQLIDSYILNNIPWEKITGSITLYQREKKYNSVTEFLKNPPHDSLIGTVGLENSPLNPYIKELPEYQSSNTTTIISTPLRGSHTLLAYLKNEPFKIKITKQDLNWYSGEDSLRISIYKGTDLVLQQVIPDDGIIDSSRKTEASQTISLQNPGPELPESGLYKIVLEGNTDILIKRIETNLHKVVFENQIYPAASSESYSRRVTLSSPTTFFTNSLLLNIKTAHPQSFQTIKIGTSSAELNKVDFPMNVIPTDALSEVTLPKSDAVVVGILGYFSFNRENFFNPLKYLFIPLSTPEQINAVDYVLANYNPPEQYNDWRMTETTFDVSSAYVDNNELSWIIKVPNLKTAKRNILIKDISVTLDKKPTIKVFSQ